MRSPVSRKPYRGSGDRTASDGANSMEFADLLDGIAPPPAAPGPHADAEVSSPVMFRVSPEPDEERAAPVEPVVEHAVVSRFADNGIDDDLLPLRTPRRRHRR
jgi:hypothetical protein